MNDEDPEPTQGPAAEPPGVTPSAGSTAAIEPAVAPTGVASVVPAPPPSKKGVKSYTYRFAVVYVVLGMILAAALVALVVLVIKPGHKASPPWSAWKPASGSTASMTKQISDHVAHEYKLNAKGTQLLAVIPSNLKVTSGTNDVAIKAIAVRQAPQSNTGIQILDSAGSWQYQLCGLGTNCSIAGGTPTKIRGRLVRREALEMALYTFKFVPAVKSVVAFMPPPPGQAANTLVFLQKNDLKDQLSKPLSTTLRRATPPLPNNPDASEALTIDRLTLPETYTYQLTALQGGGAALILDPSS